MKETPEFGEGPGPAGASLEELPSEESRVLKGEGCRPGHWFWKAPFPQWVRSKRVEFLRVSEIKLFSV